MGKAGLEAGPCFFPSLGGIPTFRMVFRESGALLTLRGPKEEVEGDRGGGVGFVRS